jgi:hypothetical protein
MLMYNININININIKEHLVPCAVAGCACTCAKQVAGTCAKPSSTTSLCRSWESCSMQHTRRGTQGSSLTAPLNKLTVVEQPVSGASCA